MELLHPSSRTCVEHWSMELPSSTPRVRSKGDRPLKTTGAANEENHRTQVTRTYLRVSVFGLVPVGSGIPYPTTGGL